MNSIKKTMRTHFCHGNHGALEHIIPATRLRERNLSPELVAKISCALCRHLGLQEWDGMMGYGFYGFWMPLEVLVKMKLVNWI